MSQDPILNRFKQALVDTYGPRLVAARLFGSRARGDHRPNSDYDVAVVLDGLTSRATERRTLADLVTAILEDTGQFISAKPFRPAELDQRTPLMHEIRMDGVQL